MQSIEDFIKNYSPSDLEKISFAWNGKHAEELEDANYDFRNDVAKKLIDKEMLGSSELVRDILLAEAYLSKEIWGATGALTDLGTLLLSQSKAKYVDSFFEAKGQSFDTECGLTCYDVPVDIIREIIEELNLRLASESDKRNVEYYIGYFSEYLPRQLHETKEDQKPWWKFWQ
ncbi:hypothetical protein ACJJIQ_11015 [Microbulbifer sp. ANSA003]|uniref:hypothetical protein n=1 Tax=Microbulbifer sp. ANSA003 TaxID=3243360 RepID=UPI00404174F8